MEEYKPNSDKYKRDKNKEDEKRAEKIVSGSVVTKPKSAIKKFSESFVSEDLKNVKSYVIGDVLIPAIKKAISDIVRDGIDMLLYGSSSKRGDRRSSIDRVSYSNYYDRDRRALPDTRSTYSGYLDRDIILSSRGEAEDVLARMDELMDTYGLVRVADLYDLVGITGNYTDNKYGWTNIARAEIVRTRDGFMIKMPRAVPID